MATKRELLNLSKEIFEHFTNESLQLAKKFIALEKALDEEMKNTPGAVTKPILDIKIPESIPVANRPSTNSTETVLPEPKTEIVKSPLTTKITKELPF